MDYGSLFAISLNVLQFIAGLFVFVIALFLLVLIVVFIIDISQKKNAIRRNYPVIGRLRYFFEHLGKFFRQYFFAMEREELPFNREQRNWVSRATKSLENTVSFGSTRDLHPPGTFLFVNNAFAMLETDTIEPRSVMIGPGCRTPYSTDSLFNVSAMSYGSISKPAVLALSNGARMASCWLNTGEGGLSPWHLEGGADLVFQIGTAKFGVRTPAGALDEERLCEVASQEKCACSRSNSAKGLSPARAASFQVPR